MPDRAALIAKCRALASQGADHEALVSFLRKEGCWKIDSIAVLREVLGVSLGRAKEIVHLSETWRDHRESDDQLHEQAEAAAIALAKEGDGCCEIWINKPDGQSLCALINGNKGWLMYLRKKGDAGFSSRNADYDGDPSATLEYVLSNGQRDHYPASWALPVSVVERAMDYFEKEGKPPAFVRWHNDSKDGVEIEFVSR